MNLRDEKYEEVLARRAIFDPDKQFLTRREAAQLLQVSVGVIDKAIKRKWLPEYWLGTRCKAVSRDELMQAAKQASAHGPTLVSVEALFLTRHEAAALLGANVQLIDQMIGEKRLRAHQPTGRRIWIRRDELLKAAAGSLARKGAGDGNSNS